MPKKQQLELLQFFVAEVTARTAADLTGLNRNTVALFYHKIRLVIYHQLSLFEEQYFAGEVELNESYFDFFSLWVAVCAKEKEGVVRQVK